MARLSSRSDVGRVFGRRTTAEFAARTQPCHPNPAGRTKASVGPEGRTERSKSQRGGPFGPPRLFSSEPASGCTGVQTSSGPRFYGRSPLVQSLIFFTKSPPFAKGFVPTVTSVITRPPGSFSPERPRELIARPAQARRSSRPAPRRTGEFFSEVERRPDRDIGIIACEPRYATKKPPVTHALWPISRRHPSGWSRRREPTRQPRP